MLEYKNYRGKVEYIEDAKIFHGEVLGTRDVITFQGETPDEIETGFRDSIDDYLEFCEERGEEPDKPYSGKFVLRMPEELHRSVAELAKIENVSLNTVVLCAVSELLLKNFSAASSLLSSLLDASKGFSEADKIFGMPWKKIQEEHSASVKHEQD